MPSRLDDVTVTGTLKAPNTAISPQTRATILEQDPLAVFPIPWDSLRVWDAYTTNLPGTAASDDLGLIGGTFGSAPPKIQAGDLKNAGATSRFARFQVILPECYEAGQTVNIVVSAKMETTVASTSCTVDIEAYQLDKVGGISADLCATAAQSINSTTQANKTFAITASTLAPGDVLDIRLTIACNDTGTGTAVTPTIYALDLQCDIKG